MNEHQKMRHVVTRGMRGINYVYNDHLIEVFGSRSLQDLLR